MGKTRKTAAAYSQNTTGRLARLKRDLAIEYRPISILSSDPKNPRLHNEKQVRQIARSIEAFGFNVPVLVDSALRVIAGNGRVQIPVHRGQSFRRIADSVPVIADSF